MDTTTLHLDLTVKYDLNGMEPKEMEQRLRKMIAMAIGDGLLTGHTEAEVDEYRVDIAVDPEHHRDAIQEYLQSQMESGNLRAEALADKLANYGLMPLTDFLDEMEERGAVTKP